MGSGASRAGPLLARPTPLLPGQGPGRLAPGRGGGASSLTSAIFAVLTGHISAAAAAGSRPEPGCETRQRDSNRCYHCRLCCDRRRCFSGNAQEPPERAHHTPLRPLAATRLSWTGGKKRARAGAGARAGVGARARARTPAAALPHGAARRGRSQGGCVGVGGRWAS